MKTLLKHQINVQIYVIYSWILKLKLLMRDKLLVQYQNKMNTNKEILNRLSILSILVVIMMSQCCVRFENDVCVGCAQNMHLYRNNCIYNRIGCESYSNGFDCSSCMTGYILKGVLCEKQVPKIETFSTDQYKTRTQFTVGYNYFTIKYSSVLKGSTVYILSKSTLGSVVSYRIVFISKTRQAYEAIYMADISKNTFKVLSFSKIDIQLPPPAPIIPNTQPSVPEVQKITTLSPSVFNKDKNFINIQNIVYLLYSSQLNGSEITEVVMISTTSLTKYKTTYKTSTKTIMITTSINSDNQINVVDIVSTKDQTSSLPSGKLTQLQYMSNLIFQMADSYLKTKYTFLSNAKITNVQNVVDGKKYIITIVYSTSTTQTYFIIEVNGSNINILETNADKNTPPVPPPVPPVAPPVPPVVTTPPKLPKGFLTAAQYTTDIGFNKIHQFITSTYKLILIDSKVKSVMYLPGSLKDLYTIVYAVKPSDTYFTVSIDNKFVITVLETNSKEVISK